MTVIYYLEDEDFDQSGVLKFAPKKPVLLLIEGSFCHYCKELKPVMTEIMKSHSNKVEFARIKIDGNDKEKKLARRLDKILPDGFKGVPTILLYKDGKYVSQYMGIRSAGSIKSFIDNNI